VKCSHNGKRREGKREGNFLRYIYIYIYIDHPHCPLTHRYSIAIARQINYEQIEIRGSATLHRAIRIIVIIIQSVHTP